MAMIGPSASESATVKDQKCENQLEYVLTGNVAIGRGKQQSNCIWDTVAYVLCHAGCLHRVMK
jgi:hypothetical protein